jgi:alkylation response protein AidB-like acyl-CoA dehydrogenase
MDEAKLAKGGAFLIESTSPQDVFTPEDFTEEQRLIAKATTEFVVGEVQPLIEDLEAQKEGLMPSLVKRAGELGLLSADIPEEYGGQDLDKISSLLITEKMTQGGASFIVACVVHTGIGSLPIIFFGNKDQKRRYLPDIATGKRIAAYALTEPDAGSDALNARTTATLSPDGKYYLLSGQKQFISNSGFADLFVTYAKIDGEKFTSFIVERKFEGVSVDEEEKKMGCKGSSTRSVIYSDARVPVENVLGEIGKGHVVAFNTLNIGRYKLGGGCVGSSKIVLQEAVNHAKQRVQFGKPIAEFGLIKHKIAEMTIRTFAVESMVYRTAGLIDRILSGIDHGAEDSGIQMARGIEEYAIEDSINKVYSSEMLDYVVDEGLQVFGGYGYIQDYSMERHYRDSRINRIWEGTNEINRLLIMDMFMKRATKNRLPLLAAAQKVGAELLSLRTGGDADDGKLTLQKEMVEMAKKITLLVAGAAVQKFMMRLADEQEILALLSDMAIEVFAMESVLLRALKSMGGAADERAEIQKAMGRVYINDGFSRVEGSARQALAAIAEGDVLRTQLSALKKLTRYNPINTVALRREIADTVIRLGRYPF